MVWRWAASSSSDRHAHVRAIAFLVLWLMLAAGVPAHAGTLDQAALAKRFPAPLQVGPKDAEIPAWPIFKQNATAAELVGYVFESADMAPIPGFAGVPMNMLVAIDPQGSFIGVTVLSHHEPVFLDGLGEAPLFQFVTQYKGLSLKQNINIDSKTKRERAPDAANAYLDGVSKATASVRILNQSVLSAALKVARKKLGFAQGRDPDQVARIRMDIDQRLSVAQMLARGMIAHVRVSNSQVEALFAGTAGEGLDPAGLAQPGETFIDLYLAQVSVPSIGRSLLTPASWSRLSSRLEEGDHAILVMSSGRYSVIGDDFIRGSITDRIVLRQDKLPIDMRDLDLDMKLADPAALSVSNITVFRVIAQAGLDAASALDFSLPVTRLKGMVYPERIVRPIAFQYRLPAQYYVAPQASNKSWPGIWKGRAAELAVLVAGLAILAVALALQKRLTADGRQLQRFRALYLLFTAGFIGYYAQGQLSIVNVTGVIQSLVAGRSLEFFLYDPMTVILWAFVAVTLLIWGRGTFCGWLCPFGALQELTGKLGQALRFPQLMIRTATDARLKRIKYVLLAAIVASAVWAPAATDMLVELEPFKTAITLNFVRSWPYVAYAVALLLLSMFSYKFFCRYLCPFGGALALMGRVRLLDWIPRRKECGTPCQTCRHRCEYEAIKPGGGISYDECFQCLDCVVIYESDEKCAPLMLEIKRARVIPIVRTAAQ
jgi:NosR/NirI family nitrous oxide reductase transcriptional regulator